MFNKPRSQRTPVSAGSTLQRYWHRANPPEKIAQASKSNTAQKLPLIARVNCSKSARASFRDASEHDAPCALKRLVSVRQDLTQIRAVYQKGLYEALTRAYELALTFELSDDDWLEFCQHPMWQSFKGRRPIPSDRSDTLRFVLRFLVGFNGAAATRRANRYFAALKPAFEDGLSPTKLPLYIRNGGGIVALARSNKKRRKSH